MMELGIAIVVNIVVGVVAAALIIFFRARAKAAPPPLTAESALEIFRVQFPETQGSATVSADGRMALVGLDGGVGLLYPNGRRWNARVLRPGDVADVRACAPHTLRLKFRDYAWPRTEIGLEDEAERERWTARLQELVRASSAPREGLSHA
jgi:hypothetical protein